MPDPNDVLHALEQVDNLFQNPGDWIQRRGSRQNDDGTQSYCLQQACQEVARRLGTTPGGIADIFNSQIRNLEIGVLIEDPEIADELDITGGPDEPDDIFLHVSIRKFNSESHDASFRWMIDNYQSIINQLRDLLLSVPESSRDIISFIPHYTYEFSGYWEDYGSEYSRRATALKSRLGNQYLHTIDQGGLLGQYSFCVDINIDGVTYSPCVYQVYVGLWVED